ncbi:zinc finger, AN1-type domain [Clonorchis sinensis]|uniref:Zinc finger, AN1-type domain n=1 Tax=Clonorchis sinensis TaxID=79923 RepID=A0A8T1M7Z3_CLOSI|nr:zinc finger, AN1-type domain [Clonorchis sinensis]
MEFPELGAHCSFSSCRRLDFLPVKCVGCHGLYCKEHYPYAQHNCRSPGIQDKQVPVCPLCNTVVPIRPGESPDERVGQHIDTACKSQPALELKGKIFPNACSLPKCKRREAVLCPCERCGLNYCVTHRNELDHNCEGPQRNQANQRRVSAAGAAAIFRAVFRNSHQSRIPNQNNNNQAPADRIRYNSAEEAERKRQEEEDRQLALAISASLMDDQPGNEASVQKNSSCNLS